MARGARTAEFFLQRPSWMAHAACFTPGGTLTTLFYVNTQAESQDVIERYCHTCPVRPQCLEYALEGSSPSMDHGVWGGTTARERRRIRRQRQRARRSA